MQTISDHVAFFNIKANWHRGVQGGAMCVKIFIDRSYIAINVGSAHNLVYELWLMQK